jgi:hypothetical protein
MIEIGVEAPTPASRRMTMRPAQEGARAQPRENAVYMANVEIIMIFRP